jgi:hypothetical protein
MTLLNIITIYLVLGSISGMSIEALMDRTELNDDTSNIERFLWVILWPFFVILFVIGMKK